MSRYDLDVLVIGGGGSGGFTAATTAMKSGARVGMVEAARLGGLCILAGCMPSKTLIHSAAGLRHDPELARKSYPQVIERKQAVVEYLAGTREEAVKAKQAKGLITYRGQGRFQDSHTVSVSGEQVTAAKIVVATGSAEIVPSIPGLEETGFLTSESFMNLQALPESLIVLGGGAIALEMGQYAARMGVKVTLIQRSQHLLSSEAPQVGEALAEALIEDGVTIFTGTELTAVGKEGQEKVVSFNHQGKKSRVQAQEILLCLGRSPNTGGLNLEAAGLSLKNGALAVDGFMRTGQEHIFAAGDVTGVRMVVNLAILQGEIAGYNATHEQMRQIDDSVLPWAVFCDPQFARVGLNHAQAEAAGLDFVEASYPLEGMGSARTYPKDLKGLMCMRAAASDGRILGAEIVAPEASLLIHDTVVAMKLKGTPKDLAEIPYLHPCLSEITNFCAHRLARKLAS
ncbi:MAG: FAD-dependent oxidoreductase [Desulfarculaceae bacterium]|jgi:pyruvate/2-oxoglutarate dehydrogenase complex dihydrolipoamide dehydrogenase (E3) component